MFQLDSWLVCPLRGRRPAGTLPYKFMELMALKCGLRVTNYMVGESLSSWPSVRKLQVATTCTFVAASCYCLGIGVCTITMGVYAISLRVFAIMLEVFISRTLSNISSKLNCWSSFRFSFIFSLLSINQEYVITYRATSNLQLEIM